MGITFRFSRISRKQKVNKGKHRALPSGLIACESSKLYVIAVVVFISLLDEA